VAEVGKLAGARIEASFKLDASILGGTVVRIGSTVYDGSVRGRLDRLKEAALKPVSGVFSESVCWSVRLQ
jgi:F0F1-type ATP synthase delta subunit